MALSSTGYGFDPLAKQLSVREGALAFNALRTASHRATIWNALTRLANGVHLMHRQSILHRKIGAENVFADPAIGPTSWRLGGFDLAFRFGSETPLGAAPQRWSGGPADLGDGASFAADWYQFGALLARVFGDFESIALMPADQRHEIMVRDVEAGTRVRLTRRERELILRLLGFRADDRLISGERLVEELAAVAHGLAAGTLEVNTELPLVLVFNPGNQLLLDACQDAGFYPTDDKLVPFRLEDTGHVAALRDFLQANLREAELHRLAGGEKAILCGERITLFITQFDKRKRKDEPSNLTWDFAFLVGPTELVGSDPEGQRDLHGLNILPVPRRNLSAVGRSQPWTTVLPPVKRSNESRMTRDLALLHDFVRCTNQLDLLFTSARIFPYLVERQWRDEDGWEHLHISEAARDLELPSWSLVSGGLVALLMEEVSSGKEHCREVLLTDHSRLSTGYQPNPEEWWEIHRVNREGEAIELRRRPLSGKTSPPPERGFIRTYGLYGQFSLVERRRRAIDGLKDHRFLLRTLTNPACRDSKVFNDEIPFPDWLETKRIVMEDVERVRPIYALQGPPGTGKTTFEAQHLRRVFEEYPESQVLVTAQAHVAVDVLRRKVRDEAFNDKAEHECPLAIRLGWRDDGLEDKDSIESVSRRLLEETLEQMRALESRTDIQDRWLQLLERALAPSPGKTEDSLLRAMRELLKSGAAITYCTTSASDLAALAESSEFDHNYDLVIVEESGRVHAFDLALPLEAGHRWLLLGDHKQLPPFQIRQFEEALKNLDYATEALERLGETAPTDSDWLERWGSRSAGEKEDFKAYALNRLRYFKWLHEHLGGKDGDDATTTELKGTGAGMLRVQFRMHPVICEVISRAFYDNKLVTDPKSLDGDGNYKLEYRHRLRIRDVPAELNLQDRAAVWIDLPRCSTNSRYKETGQEQGKLNFRNYEEVEAVDRFIWSLRLSRSTDKPHSIAVLTPYRQQVIALQQRLRGRTPPTFLQLVASLGVRKPEERTQWVHTVDSFQGNEADVIITSLVRNNTLTTVRSALGFIADPERLNVILSRAKQLLVLVGSWDFFRKWTNEAKKGDDLWFFRTALDTLEEYFRDGRAVRIPVEKLPPVLTE
jgi:hypothetical protein